MAKTATASTLPPLHFALGQTIVEEDLQAVAEQLNYSAGNATTCYLNLITGDANWWTGGTGEISTHLATSTSATFAAYLRLLIYIDDDEQVITVESISTNPAATTSEVRYTVGGAGAVTLTHAAASTTTSSNTINVSSTGTGWQLVTVEFRRASGTGTSVMRAVRVQSNAIAAASLPDPVNS